MPSSFTKHTNPKFIFLGLIEEVCQGTQMPIKVLVFSNPLDHLVMRPDVGLQLPVTLRVMESGAIHIVIIVAMVPVLLPINLEKNFDRRCRFDRLRLDCALVRRLPRWGSTGLYCFVDMVFMACCWFRMASSGYGPVTLLLPFQSFLTNYTWGLAWRSILPRLLPASLWILPASLPQPESSAKPMKKAKV